MRAQIVSFHCVLRNQVGSIISSTFNQDVITHIEGKSGHLQGLIEGMQDLHKGEKRRIAIAAPKAYGFYDPKQVVEFSRSNLARGASLEVGDEIVSDLSGGEQRVYRVIAATRDAVTLDANHPLAGQDLVFEIEATDARDATTAEIAESREDELPTNLH